MIEFIQESHTYLVFGVITPSVSRILSTTIFKDKYSGIPDYILENAAKFGTAVHKAIETGEYFDLEGLEVKVYDNYLDLVFKEQIEPIKHEQVVSYENIYAGTYDMVANVKGKQSLVDVKTTYNLDKEYLSWQLSLYELASGIEFEKLYCIWLPKRKGAELVEIKRKTKEELMWLLEEYKRVAYEQIDKEEQQLHID